MVRAFIAFALILAAVFAATSCASPAPEDSRSNIVFILADDMRASDFEHMPQARRLLADGGLSFSEAFVTHSLCCPSRASLLRGQYTHNHQVITNAAPEGGFEKFRSAGHEDSNVATWLRDSGYQTVLVGKYLNGYARKDDETYVPPGWDEWYGALRQEGYYDYRMNENGTVVSYGDAEEDYHTDVLAEKARAYVWRAAGSSGPFFMYLAPATPHGPFIPAPRHEDAFADASAPRPPSFNEADVGDKPAWLRSVSAMDLAAVAAVDRVYRNRLRMLLSLDALVADLVGELEAAGVLDNTYVIFTSDNGYHLGEHRIPQGKRTVYEEAVRVPLAVRGPGMTAGRVVEQPVLNIDLAPTLAELAGVPAPEFVDGRSLAPFFAGAPPETWRSAFLLEHWNGGGGALRSTPTYSAVRTDDHKYVEYDGGERELYELAADPYELENAHESADPTLIQSLASRLQALRTCSGASCRAAEEDLP